MPGGYQYQYQCPRLQLKHTVSLDRTTVGQCKHDYCVPGEQYTSIGIVYIVLVATT